MHVRAVRANHLLLDTTLNQQTRLLLEQISDTKSPTQLKVILQRYSNRQRGRKLEINKATKLSQSNQVKQLNYLMKK